MTQPGLKILFLSRYAGFAGGIERYEYNAAQLLREAGYVVHLAYQEQARDFALFAAGFNATLNLSEALAAAANYDLVAVHKIYDADWLRKILAAFADKLALFVHDHEPYCPRRYYYTPFGRRNCQRRYSWLPCTACALMTSPRHWQQGAWAQGRGIAVEFPARLDLFRQFPRVVVLSDFMRGNLLHNGFSPEKVLKLSPFVTVRPNARPQSVGSPPGLLFVGQLIRGKGADLLLQTLSRLTVDFRAVIAGDGFDRPWLEKLASELSLTSKVTFAGWIRDTEKLYAESDLLIIPSRWQEPFGLIGMEAAAQGLPIAGFDLGGCREYLLPGKNGLLIPAGQVDELARQISALLQEPNKMLTFGEAGRLMAKEKFSPEKFLRDFTGLLMPDKG